MTTDTPLQDRVLRLWVRIKPILVRASTLRSWKINLLIYAFVIWRALTLVANNWNDIRNIPWHLSYSYILLAIIAYLVSYSVWNIVWRSLVGLFSPTNWPREMRVYANTTMLRRIPLVSAAWRYGGRALIYKEAGMSNRHVATVIIAEILLHSASGCLVFAVLTFLMNPVSPLIAQYATVGRIAGASVIAACVVVWSIPARSLSAIIRTPIETIHYLKRQLPLWLGLYAITWVAAGVMTWFFFGGVTANSAYRLDDVTLAFTVAGLIGYIVALTPIPTQGTFELSFAYLVSIQLTSPVTAVIGLVFTVFVAVTEIASSGAVLSVLALYQRGLRRQQPH